jgi:hypothetical protein
MINRSWEVVACGVFALILLGLVSQPASADHPGVLTYLHVKDQNITFRLHAGSLNTAQRIAITAAAEEWETDIGKAAGGLDFAKGSNYTGSSPETAWNDATNSNRLIWQGAFVGSWDCVPSWGACTLVRRQATNYYHIRDVDTIFRWDIYWPSDGSTCEPPHDVDYNDGDSDQFSAALHEFGHWQSLDHPYSVTPLGTVMHGHLDFHCWTDVNNHDHVAVYENYDADGTHSHVAHF